MTRSISLEGSIWASSGAKLNPDDDNSSGADLLTIAGGNIDAQGPYANHLNFWQNRADSLLNAVEQNGILEWSNLTTYNTDDFCKIGRSVYASLTDGNQGNDPAVSADWSIAIIPQVEDGTITTAKLAPKAVTIDKIDAPLVQYVDTIADLRALEGLEDGQAVNQGGLGSGLFYWRSGDKSTEVAADEVNTGEGDGGVWIAPASDKTGASGAWQRAMGGKPYARWRQVEWYRPVGDGVTDDTPAFLAARGDTSEPITLLVGTPDTSYVLANFQMGAGCTIQGAGKEVSKIVGNGADTAILFGDGAQSLYRDNEIYDCRIENAGAGCIYGSLSPNWKIKRCYIRSTGGDGTFNTVHFTLSVRGDFSENEGGISGDGWGLALRQDCNGQTVHHNQWTGGSLGGAITAGICQGLSIKHNIVEASLNGIYVSSTNDTGDGNCNGVEIDNNYIEQCRNPFAVGVTFSVIGWSMKNNYVGNNNVNVISARDACFKLGRLRNGEFSGNSVTLASDNSENLFEFVIITANDIYNNVYKRGNVAGGAAAAEVVLSGALSGNAGALRNFGGQNFFDFLGNVSSPDIREYVSPPITANVGVASHAWLRGADLAYGGQVVEVTVIQADGDLSGADLRVGYTGAATGVAQESDLDTLTYDDGQADVPLSTSVLVGGGAGNNLLRVVAGTGSGTFRVRIRYRAT